MGIFKAYDIRGIVGKEIGTAQGFAIGYGLCRFLSRETGKESARIVVGRDMRESSPELARAFAAGIESTGGIPVDAGLCTTPMLYAAVGLSENVDGGAIVTASHNGPEYNGFKLCRRDAIPISGDTGLKNIEAFSASAPALPQRLEPKLVALKLTGVNHAPPLPHSDVVPDLWGAYSAFVGKLKRTWPRDVHLGVDPAHGMGCLYLPLLRWLGADVVSINDHLDGRFPAHEANPIKAENLAATQALVRQSRATLGVAFDGDADRVAFVDRHGNGVPSDLLTGVLARSMLARHPGSHVLYDLRSSRAVAEVIEESGGHGVRERVGHSFMKATMRRENCVVGGELSGHYYYRDAFFADSSIITVIEVLNAMGAANKELHDLIAPIKRYRQSGEINFEVADKDAAITRLLECHKDGRADRLDGLTVQYDDWWFNVRPSNTEPLLRLNVEANSQALLESHLETLQALLGKK